MRRLLFIIAILCSTIVGAQQPENIIYLYNGSIIKGEILEQIPNKTIKTRTADGSIFVYKMSEVSKIIKEETQTENTNFVKRKSLEYKLGLGYLIGVGDYKKTSIVPMEFGLGKQINKNFYIGGSLGAWIGTNEGAKTPISLSLDTKVLFPGKSSITPFWDLNLSYGIVTGTYEQIKYGGYNSYDDYETETVKYPDIISVQLMPGIKLPLSKRADFFLAAGYTHSFQIKGNTNGGYFSIKTGLMFHKSPDKPQKERKKKASQPTREKGFLWTLEGGMNFKNDINGGLDMIFGAKINPHLNLGIGLGYDLTSPFSYSENAIEIITSKEELSGSDEISHSLSPFELSDLTMLKTYFRGVYRILDKRFSPIITCDLGLRYYIYGTDNVYDPQNMSNTDYKKILGDPQKIGFFASPAIGFSLRTTNNSYIEVKGGYSMAPNIFGQKTSLKEGSYTYFGSCAPINVSYPYFTIGFTHIFGKKVSKK